jgi:hypothetical protein
MPLPELVKIVVEASHTEVVPLIADGNGFTVTTALAWQPVDNIYVILEVPEATPVTTPLPVPIVAMAVLPLLQLPLPELVSVVVEPVQTSELPLIADGNGFTVATIIAWQPVDNA